MTKFGLLVSLSLAVGCASATGTGTTAEAAAATPGIEIVVRNDFAFPITVEAYWEDARTVVLGDLGGRGQTRTFTTEHRDRGLTLFVRETSGGVRAGPEDSNMRSSDRPQTFVDVEPGDRLEAIVDGANRNGRFLLPIHISPNSPAR